MIAIFSLIFFGYRLASHKFKGYWEYHNFDRVIAEKYGIYSLCIEGKKYARFHLFGIVLSALVIVLSFFDVLIPYYEVVSSLVALCGFTFVMFYTFKFEKTMKEATANLFHCVRLLNSYIYTTTKGQYSNRPSYIYSKDIEAKEADEIETLYLCCQFDRDMLIWDAIALGLFALSLIFIVPI